MIITIQETRWKMKLKNWASVCLMIITGGCILSLFIGKRKISITALIIATVCAAIYGKYSKLTDRR